MTSSEGNQPKEGMQFFAAFYDAIIPFVTARAGCYVLLKQSRFTC
jgi:hypothetical protein